MRRSLERYFEFDRLQTTWRTEILAGATTFVTMAYIVFVNPSILHDAGMPFQAVVAATCFCAAFGSILMGAFARYPIALAPGMGLNAYFAYTIVKGMGVSWQTALGAVFLSGVAFLLLTAVGVRQLIVEAIPTELYAAVAAGIGLFIALIGLRNAGIVAASPATLVTLGNLHDKNAALALFGLALTSALMAWRVRAAMLLGILGTTLAGIAFGLVKWAPETYRISDIAATAGKLDIRAAAHIGLLEIVFVFLFVDLFDNIGTLVGVGKKAGLFDEANRIPRLSRILISDALATIAGSLAGTSTVTSYIESAAGVVAGGRTGVTAIVTGLLFAAALFVAPLIGAVPSAATAPALILVGSLMLSHVAEIRWNEPQIAIPAFLTIVTIPLTFSIATGLSFGFTAYAILRLARGEFQKKDWLVYVLAAIFVARFFYLGAL
ncbi:MAG TPA: NCS2 family permease [Bryobacteraceae bacterium]|jgi:AGZA family xanthine/uracil permease-like MFS transporter